MRFARACLAGTITLAVAGVVVWRRPAAPDPSISADLTLARAALLSRRFEQAERLACQALSADPENVGALLVAGEAATRQEHYEDALAYYSRARDDGRPDYVTVLLAAGEVERHIGRLSAAERTLRAVLERDPENVLAHDRLAFVLGVSGRRWEATPHLLQVVRSGQFAFQDLLHLGNVERLVQQTEYLSRCRDSAPDDPLPLLGLARGLLARRRVEDAHDLLLQAVEADPRLIETQVQRGWLLLQSAPPHQFLAWHAALTPAAETHPDLWAIRGRWFQDQGERAAALRCYGESVRRDPDHRLALHQCGQLLQSEGHAAAALPLLERAERLQHLCDALDELERSRQDLRLMDRVAHLTSELGRTWETIGWAQVGLALDPQSEWAGKLLRQTQPLVADRAPLARTVDAARLWARLDPLLPPLSALPSPARRGPGDQQTPQRLPMIQFSDRAAAAGIEFTYFNSHDPAADGMRMFEFSGGGVAAIDFDCDGWPDLHFTQGCQWPVDDTRTLHRDRMFRNLGNDSAADVTDHARTGDHRYSQGVAVGDMNADGFPDLYVGNIGVNRLYLNNGDGTFDDATARAELTSAVWTTSCALVDVSGDGLPDLYDVNYLAGEGVFTSICQKDGVSRACDPTVFAAEQDRLLLNRGDGTFRDVTESAGIIAPRGNGLGVVAADLNADGELDLFIANDATANFLFLSQGRSAGFEPRFTESALRCGVAFDGYGRAQACMGVACGDSDGDALVDLFVTNFYHEYNTLYRQVQPGLFVDDTAAAGMLAPSFELLGFGTQFLDANLDGRPDLVVANGHVDDFSHQGIPYRMRPQFFHNVGDGRFEELFAESLGSWFSQPQLGRGLARCDWNRDGRDDFVVSHLDTPAALLLNETLQAGQFVAVRLVGVHGARDAIGAVVSGRAGEGRVVMQLTAGDGYEASNERRLTFGLGAAERLDDVRIAWPGGGEQQLGVLEAGTEYVLVEGHRPRAVRRDAALWGDR